MRVSARALLLSVALIGFTGAAQAEYASGNTTITGSGITGSGYPSGDYQGANGVYTNGYSGPTTGMDPNALPINPATGMVSDSQRRARIAQPQPMTAMSAAQGNSRIISDPQQIRSCLCMETQYEILGSDVNAKQSTYMNAQSQRAALESQINAARSSTPANLDQIRQASQQRIQLLNAINQQYIPQMQQATDRYNQTVSSYQQMCGGHAYDTDTMSRVKTGLQCQGG